MKSNSSKIHLIASTVALPGKEEELREVLRALLEPTRNEDCSVIPLFATLPSLT
jgi:quinol monooxygenase YgiN